GPVAAAPAEEARADLRVRSTGALAAALTGRQSEVLGSVDELARASEAAWERAAREPDAPVPSWTLYRLRPDEVEFFQGDARRRHVRLRYRRVTGGAGAAGTAGAGERAAERGPRELLWPWAAPPPRVSPRRGLPREVVHREVGDRAVADALVEGVAGGVGQVGEEQDLLGAVRRHGPAHLRRGRARVTAPAQGRRGVDADHPALPGHDRGTAGHGDRGAVGGLPEGGLAARDTGLGPAVRVLEVRLAQLLAEVHVPAGQLGPVRRSRHAGPAGRHRLRHGQLAQAVQPLAFAHRGRGARPAGPALCEGGGGGPLALHAGQLPAEVQEVRGQGVRLRGGQLRQLQPVRRGAQEGGPDGPVAFQDTELG